MPEDAMRYRGLGYAALNVRSLERSIEFYTRMVGLELVDVFGEDLALLRCGPDRVDVALYRGERPGLKRVAWRMEDDRALAAAREKVRALGLAQHEIAPDEADVLGIGGGGFRTTEPTTGATFEFFAGMASAGPFVPTHTKIAQLGHVVVGSPDRLATERTLVEDFNFRVSDRVEDTVCFLRCWPNPFHHSFGVSAGGSRLHHVNFMVREIDDIGKAMNRLRRNDVPIVFGPGRHPPSESVFLYFLDPDGLTCEYSFGMEEFDADAPRSPRDLPRRLESIDSWGGRPSPDMGTAGELERLAERPSDEHAV